MAHKSGGTTAQCGSTCAMRAHPDDGFTLTEMLIVMVVTAVLAAIAIPVLLNQ